MLKQLTDIRDKFNALMGAMAFHQKVTLVVLGVTVLAPFIYLSFGKTETGLEPLQFGAAYDRESLMKAEQTLMDRGFTDFKTVGNRIMAPKSKITEYNAALFSNGAGSPHAGTEWEKNFQTVNVFTPRDQFEEGQDIRLKQELHTTLSKMDGVQDVKVNWARSKSRSRWPNTGSVTATVHVTPKSGRDVTNELASSLRDAVIGMVPDLKKEFVTVIDYRTGRAFKSNDSNDPFDSKAREYKEAVIRDYHSRISGALSFIPDVVVSVNVEFDNLKMSRERKQQIDPKTVEMATVTKSRTATNVEPQNGGVAGTTSNQPRDITTSQASKQSTEKDSETSTQSAASVTVTESEYMAAAPKAVKVAVSVPEDYFEKVALREGAKIGETDAEKAEFRKAVETIRTREQDKVKNAIATLLPTNSPPEAVSVTSHTAIPADLPKVDMPLAMTLTEVATNWGSSFALAAFAVWALLMLKKTMPAQAAPATNNIEALVKSMKPEPPPAPVVVAAPEPAHVPRTKRELLQASIEQDPAAAAAILTKWLAKT